MGHYLMAIIGARQNNGDLVRNELAAAVAKAGYSVPVLDWTLRIEGMTCASCVGRVEKALRKVPGVLTCTVNLATETASVSTSGLTDGVAPLLAAVARAGYRATLQADDAPAVVPAGTTYARFSLFDADVSAGADIDLCVFNSAGTQVGGSGSGTSAEEVNLANPAAGTYTVVVQGWGVVGSSPFRLHTWMLGAASAGNMTVSAPATATTGSSGTIDLSFSGLAAGMKYLGSVAYGGAAGMPSPTIVRVDTP